MKKKEIFNRIRVALAAVQSGRYLRLVLVVLVSLFFIGNAWGTTTYYYTKGSVAVKTGSGTVYINKASPATDGNSTTNSTAATIQCDRTSTKNAEQTYYLSAVPEDDWRFDGWTLSGWSTNPGTAATTTGKIKAASTSSGSPSTATAQATFVQISITGVSPTTKTLAPTDARESCTDYTGTVEFTTTNDNAADQIGTPAFSDKLGSGKWEATKSWAAGKTTVTYTFKGNGYYGGSGTSSGSRNNSATLTLPTAKGTSSKSVTFTANFPSLVLSAGSSGKVYPTSPTTTVDGKATFPVQYCDGAFDFEATITNASGGTWAKGDISVAITDAATGSGTVTVPFTFNAGGATDDFSATLTLTPVANTGGTAQSVTITAYAEPEAVNEASVTPAGGSATEYATFGEALAAANGLTGSTLTLLKNIDLGTIAATNNVSKAMTIDLNGKTLKANSTAAIALLTINKNVEVTIKDSKSGGMIYNTGEINGVVYGVTVSNGTLNVTSGTIKAENTQQYFYGTSSVGGTATNKTSVGARGIQQAAATTVNISGSANIQGYASRNAYGIREEGSKANNTTLNITGGTVYAEAASYAYGVYGLGKVNIREGATITSQINTNTVNGNETYTNYRINTSKALDSYTLNGYGYGVHVTASVTNKAADCYFGTLDMTGGTVNSYDASTNMVGTTVQGQNVYGVYIGAGAAIKKTNTAPDGTLTQKGCGIGQITGGTINVVNEGATSYGVIVCGSYNSSIDTESIFSISNAIINVTSHTTAYGVMANATTGTSSTNYGGCYAGKIMLENNNVTTTTTVGSTSVALYATSTMTTIKTATSATYAGEYEASAYMYVKSGTYTANSKTSYATAAIAGPWTTSNPQRGAFKTYFAVDGSLGGNKESMSGMYIQGGTFTANATTSHARGVWNSGAVVIAGGTFNANATTTNAYGIYSNRGTVQATNATLSATAGTGTAYGVFSEAMINDYVGWKYAADNTLTNCNITAKTTTGNTAYGVYIKGTTRTISSVNSSYASIGDVVLGGYAAIGNASVKGCTITATSAGTTAGGVYRENTQVSADKTDIAQGELTVTGNTITATTNGGTTGYGIRAGGPSTIKDNNITVTTSTTGSNGIIVGDGEHTISGNTVTAKGTGTVYGIQTYSAVNSTTGYKFQANATLENNTVTATTTTGNTAYAVYATTPDAVTVTTAGFEGTYVAAGGVIINSGKYTATAAGTTAYAIALDATKTKNGVSGSATCTVNGGKFKGAATSTYADVNASAAAGNVVFAGGYYVNYSKLADYVADGYTVTSLTSGEVYDEGYRYQIGDNSGAIVCKVYQGNTLKKSYQSLAEALQYTQQNSGTSLTIVMVENYVVPEGDYTLPSNATLLVPYKDGQTSGIGTTASRITDAGTRAPYRTLTFASGAHLTCLGTIEVSAQQYATSGLTGIVNGPFGLIKLNEGAQIDVEGSSSKIIAWGYIIGKGIINAKRGSTMYENFQLGDYKGGGVTSEMLNNSYKVFPVSHYFYQNIEATIYYRPGSNAIGSSSATVNGSAQKCDDARLVGPTDSESLFLMNAADESEDTWVRKEYDPTTDRTTYTLNNGATLGNIKITVSVTLESKKYILPISSNMDIVFNYGTMYIQQNTYFMPGSRLIVNKEALVQIPSGVELYIIDQENWVKGYSPAQYVCTPAYSYSWPSKTTSPRNALKSDNTNLPDAEVFVHGQIEVTGSFYTSGTGANIHSAVADGGKVTFTGTATTGTKDFYQCNSNCGKESTFSYYWNRQTHSCTSAKLLNGDGSYTTTAGTTGSWCYMHYDGKDQWVLTTQSGCFTKMTYSGADHYYAYPSDFVEVNYTRNADNTYKDAATGNRYFIWDANCQWWEVDASLISSGEYKAIKADHNGKYNYYEYNSGADCWTVKVITITWDINGTTTNYSVAYKSIPKWNGTNPSKSSSNSNYYYTWTGWDNNGSFYNKNEELLPATAPTTYTAHFEQTYYQYTITFKNSAADGGQVIDAPLVTAGDIPVCGKTPTKTATEAETYTFSHWSGYALGADLPAVTGTAEYTAVYTATPRPYTVIFQNYDGTVLQESEVNYGTEPSYEGATPYRAKDAFYSYTFSGWDPAIEDVTGAATYTAQYNSTTRGYTIQFLNYDGSVLETKDVPRDQMPEYTGPAFSKPSTEAYDYSFNGWSPTLTEVTEDATYTAQYTETLKTYTITWVDGDGNTLTTTNVAYGVIPSYPGTPTPTKASTSEHSYVFNNTWSPELVPVTGEATYTAQFNETERTYVLTIGVNEAGYGSVSPTPVTGIPYNAAVTVNGNTFTVNGTTVTATPTTATAQYTYAFSSWSNVPNNVTADVSNIQAVFTRTLNTYMVTFKDYNGTQLKQQTVDWNTAATAPANPSRDGYTFTGWDKAFNAVTADLVVTAQYSVNQYTITFNSNGGSAVASITADYGASVTAPANPTLEGYTFAGWSPAVPSVMPLNGLTCEAQWTPNTNTPYVVKHYQQNIADDDYTEVTADRQELSGTTATEVTPAVKDYTGFTAPSTQTVTILADGSRVVEYYYTRNSYNLTWNANGGSLSGTYTSGSVKFGASITAPTATRADYDFDGWHDGSAIVTPAATMPAATLTYTAQWTLSGYQINFVNEDGTTSLGDYPKTLASGASVTAPAEPTKPTTESYTYTFAGWSDGTNTYASDAIPTVSAAVTYTATFNAIANVASVTVSDATTYYTTLQDAFDYAADKTTPTITVLSDISSLPATTYTNASKTTVTFDLNGHKVSGGANPLLTLTSATNNGGEFVIKSSVEGGKIYNEVSSTSARNCVTLTKGKLKLVSGTISNKNKSTGASYALKVASGRTFTMEGGTLEANGKKNAYALHSTGTSNVSGGTIKATETSDGYAGGIYVLGGTTNVSGTTVVQVSGTSNVYGAKICAQPSTSGGLYSGTLNVTGGTFTVNASAGAAVGVYSYAGTRAIDYATNSSKAKNYACAGTATISGGEFTVTSAGATAYGVYVTGTVSIATAKDADGNATYPEATATSTATITKGKFNVSGASSVAVNTSATNTQLDVQGGWYNVDGNLSGYVAPTKSCNYHVLNLPDSELRYKYEVAEAYTITFKDGDNNTIQSGLAKKNTTPEYTGATPTKTATAQYTYTFNNTWSPAIVAVTEDATYTAQFGSTVNEYTITWVDGNGETLKTEQVEYGQTPAYTGATPTKTATDQYTYTFNNTWSPAIVAVTGDASYTAQFNATEREVGPNLDIVDWTWDSSTNEGTATINANGWKAAGWPYTITISNNSAVYYKDETAGKEAGSTNYRAEDRTLTISHSVSADWRLEIIVTNKDGVIYSKHSYVVPHVFTTETTTSGWAPSSILFVRDGAKLTINANAEVNAVYVSPEAELEVSSGVTLTVDTLILRTTPWTAAVLENNGTITATKTYYTRIVKDNSGYFQFALPLASSIKGVHLSDFSKCTYGTSWILKSYSESSRAANGNVNTESVTNWVMLPKPVGEADVTIAATTGYELYSNSKYYREFYFPVDLSTAGDKTKVRVLHTNGGAAGEANAGWNAICSPLMGRSKYDNPKGDPADALKVSVLEQDGRYNQQTMNTIAPAVPFYYQAKTEGDLNFTPKASAPRRAWNTQVLTQWLQLTLNDDKGRKLDETNIYINSDRFDASYETGYDVAKQSLTGGKATLYTELACGKLAFAAISDSIAECRIPLTVYAAADKEYTFSMVENNYLGRFQYVLLYDNETGSVADLLSGDYTCELTQGTISDRFYIQCVFIRESPAVTTGDGIGVESSDSDRLDIQKIVYKEKVYIIYKGRVYDMTGRQCELH